MLSETRKLREIVAFVMLYHKHLKFLNNYSCVVVLVDIFK